jgi:hypothetical protein
VLLVVGLQEFSEAAMPRKYPLAVAGALAFTVTLILTFPGRKPPALPIPIERSDPASPKPVFSLSDATHPTETPAPAQVRQKPLDAVAKANEVLARSNSTPYEIYDANYQLLIAHHKAGNESGKLRAMQGMVDSGVLSSAEQAALVRAISALKSEGVTP